MTGAAILGLDLFGLSLDAWVAVGISALALAWLVARAVRTFRRRSGAGCGCAGEAAGCPRTSQLVEAARRAVRDRRDVPPPGIPAR